jgi:hypothetical protein
MVLYHKLLNKAIEPDKHIVCLIDNASLLISRADAPSGIRTRDPLIKSQLLYQLS